MANNAGDDTFYQTFKDVRPCWPLMVCSLPLGIMATIGMSLNFSVIYVTIRSNALKNSANYLLALCSFFELLHQSGHFIFVFTAWTGTNFVEFQSAAKFGAVSMFGLGGIAISMFFTGLDRLICVIFPLTFHQSIKLGPYLCAISLICVLPCGYQVYLLYQTATMYPRAMITGAIVDILSGPSIWFFANSNMILNTATTLLYIVTGTAIAFRKVPTSSTADQTNRRLFRSLAAIIALNMGGYLINTVFIVFVIPLIGSPITVWFWQVTFGILLNISAASNGPILYMTSKEYRKVFHAEFGPIFRLFGQKNSATEVPNPAVGPLFLQNHQNPMSFGFTSISPAAAEHHRMKWIGTIDESRAK